jgi:hypothetical protein
VEELKEEIPEEPEFIPDPEVIQRIEIQKRKMLERRQSSLEENKVMADFYGDIIKTHTLPAKPKVPIYMDPEAMKKLELEEDETQNDSGVTSSAEMSPQSTLNRPFSPPIQTQQQKQQLPFSRRASEIVKPQPKESSVERRLSDTAKVLPKLSENFSNLPLKDTIETFAPNYNRMQLNKSPSPQIMSTTDMSSADEMQTRGRSSATGTIPKRRKASQSRSRDSSTVRSPEYTQVSKPPVVEAAARRMKSSSRTRNNRSESKSPSAMNRKIIMNRVAPQQTPPVARELSQSPLSMSSRTATPISELQEQVDMQVKSTMTYVMDVSILTFATYIYFFKSAMLALPILVLLIYRQIANKIPDWMKRKKKDS